MDVSAAKRRLRRAMVRQILAMNPARRREEETALARLLPDLPGFDPAGTVLLYASAFPEEIPTAAMLLLARERGKVLACPRVDRAERRLRLHRVDDPTRDLIPGTLGIPEPPPEAPEILADQVDWALVPGLAFDPRGYRLGRGAGHYDRLLPRLRPDCPRWALAFDCQWVDLLPDEPHDQTLDGIASPGRIVHIEKKCESGRRVVDNLAE